MGAGWGALEHSVQGVLWQGGWSRYGLQPWRSLSSLHRERAGNIAETKVGASRGTWAVHTESILTNSCKVEVYVN